MIEDFITSEFSMRSKFLWDFHINFKELNKWLMYAKLFEDWHNNKNLKSKKKNLIPKKIAWKIRLFKVTLSGKFSKQYFLILGGDVRNEKWTNEFWHLSKVVEHDWNMIGISIHVPFMLCCIDVAFMFHSGSILQFVPQTVFD